MSDTLFERLNRALQGRYALLKPLGRGGMGAVYLAEDLKLRRRHVAIKVLLPEVRAALGGERFDQEVDVACHLSHPNIVPLFEAGEVDGLAFYVMGYVAGESLQDRIEREGQLGVTEALRITQEVGDALEYAHSHGIIHRDIKPANILLAAGHAVIADFGIAKNTNADRALTSAEMAVGTASYMSPEQASADKRLDRRTDVYSLAAVLYEMLSGGPPFSANDQRAIIARVMLERPEPLRTTRSEVPPHVEEAILNALSKAPADRPGSAKEFIEQLTSPTILPLRWKRRTATVTSIILVAALGGGLLWGLLHDSGFGVRHATTVTPPNSIAVLYLDNLTRDSSDAYLADGLTEELINTLGRNNRLVVKPQSSVRRYRGTPNADPITLARALNVSHLLTGSVRRWGANRVRVTVELIHAPTGTRIWGESYDVSTTDPLEIQQQVALAVAGMLVGRLNLSERAALVAFPTKSRQAYEHFLRGLYYMGPRDQPGLLRALEQFETAIRLDSTFARAYARIGLACVLIVYRSGDSVTTARFLAQGTAAIDRALQLDSTISDAWLGRGRLIAITRSPFDDAVRMSYERAISLDSTSADAHHFYAINLWYYWGEATRAIQELRTAIALEPDRLNTLNTLGFAESVARRSSDALKWWDSIVALQPSGAAPALIGAYVNRAMERLIVLRDTVGARNDVDEIRRLGNPGASHVIMALLEVRRGDTAAARSHFGQGWEMAGWSDTHCGPLEGAVLVELGEYDRALACVEHIDREEFPFLFPYLHHGYYDPVRSDARFQKALDRLRPPHP